MPILTQAAKLRLEMPAVVEPKVFPTTRFHGSKRKIVPWLHEVFAELEFDSALDLFGGSATVSYLLKLMGKKVVCNDVLKWNYLTAVALIQNDSVRLDQFAMQAPPPRARHIYRTVRDTFSGFYFTDSENAWIDRAVFSIESITGSPEIRLCKKALGYHALFQACLAKRPFNLFHRKNLYLRTAKVARSFGNKTTWERPFSEMFRRYLSEANNAVFVGERKSRATNFDARDYRNANVDLVYIDPPYVGVGQKNESAKYESCYHFLEGLARYRQWNLIIDRDSPLFALKLPRNNPFVSPETNMPALRKLFERFEKSTLVISYKKFGTPSLSWLTNELKRLGKNVRYRTRHYKYALNHQNGDASRNREILIVGT